MPRGQIIMLGMHRSGTSCVGNLLTKMGVYFGNEEISIGAGQQNRKGFFERRDVRDVCDAVLQGSGCDWWAVNDFSPERVPASIRTEVKTAFAKTLAEMQHHQPWFIKEPRLCFVWPSLSALVTNPIFLHVWRHPLEVACSLAERNGFSLDFSIALWESYVRSAFSVSRGQPSVILSYNELVTNPATVTRHLMAKLDGFGVSGIRLPKEAELEDAVDVELYRQRQISFDLDEFITPSQRQLCAALAEGRPTNPILFQPLSRAAQLRLQDWTRREGAILALRTGALEAKSLKAGIADRDERLKAERNRVKTRVRELAELKAEIVKRDDELEAERSRIQALADEVAELNAELIKTKDDLKVERDRVRALGDEIAEFRTHTARRGRRVSTELRRVQALSIELAALKSESVQLRETELAKLNDEIRRSNLLLRHERTAAPKAFLGGIRATLDTKPNLTRGRRSLYLHYLIRCMRKDANELALLAASGFFDSAYYLKRNNDVMKAGADPLIHFVDFGAAEGRNPSSLFDTAYYVANNPEIAASGKNPLLHFILEGRKQGRNPKPPLLKKAPARKQIAQPTEAALRATPSRSLPQRMVVYTAVVGGYDELKPPAFRPPNCEFVAFSDQPLRVEGWEVRPLNYLHHDPTRAARFVKLHPHIYFPDCDHSIWIDANIGIQGDLSLFFSCLAADDFIGTFIHPLRDCVYVEAQECIKLDKDDEQVIRRHIERYRADGFPEKAGLWETNVLVRRHNAPSCIALMTAWWRELEIGSRRDQLSLPVVAQRLSAEIAALAVPGQNADFHPLLTKTNHAAERIPSAKEEISPVARKSIDTERVSVNIGVCVHNGLKEAEACLASLIAARRQQDTIVVVDDASDAPTATLLDQFVNKHEGIKLIRHEQNQGYTRSANDVLKNTRSDWVVLLNSDAVVPSRALRKLVTCGEQFSRIGIVGPLSNAASWQSVPYVTGPDGKFLVNQIPSPLNVENMDELCEELSNGLVPFVPLINGFCYTIRRSVIDRIGYFDEANFPTGYGEEDDYSLRAGEAGYVCGIAIDTYVYHVKSASFTPERRTPLAAAGGAALRKKHSAERVAAAVDVMRHHPELMRIRDRISTRLLSYEFPIANTTSTG